MFMFKNIKYRRAKKKIFLVGLLMVITLFSSFKLLAKSYATYQSELKLNANIDQALYIFGGEKLSFNIDSSKIVPSNASHKYKFTVSNFNASEHSDIDLEYTLDVRTTTNLPLTIKLFKGTDLNTNLISTVLEKQDADGAWYRVFNTTDVYTMRYTDDVTDVYTLDILFPGTYSADTTYADAIENIEIVLKSKQIIE